MLLIYTGGWQVSGVAFDSYWTVPNTDGTEESIVYRFGSVGQVSVCCWFSHYVFNQLGNLIM